MKILLFLLYLLPFYLYSSTCTTISRTDLSYGSVLSSSKYNSDLNTVYSAANSFDGGCVQAGTIEYDGLDSTSLEPLKKGVRFGCEISYNSASTLTIQPCLAMVNNSYVGTSTTTSVAWTNLDTGSETATTNYYVYIKTGSLGTTLTPEISVTAPNKKGYNTDGDMILGSFFNNTSGDIATASIYQWINGRYIRPNYVTESYIMEVASVSSDSNSRIGGFLKEGSCTGTTPRTCYFELDYFVTSPKCKAQTTTTSAGAGGNVIYEVQVNNSWIAASSTTQYFVINAYNPTTGATTSLVNYELSCTGVLTRGN